MEPLGTILVIEDDPAVVRAAELVIRHAGGAAFVLSHPDQIATLAADARFDAALLDMNFAAGLRDGSAGLAALTALRGRDPALGVVVLTAHGGVALAVRTLQCGACDFLIKPWRNAQLVEALQAAAALTRKQRAEELLDLDGIERRAIEKVLTRHQGNISKAASALGLTRPALYRRLEKHGLQ